ncbi:MAG: agmatine deiminase family protein, partial [Flavobacteriales bacterium]|nr:agmatine deiminase family protein [Flavobacteriales bacterium]
IDMHMKLLDEETLLVGEYPAGVADGPQIEANLDYILNNFNSVYGTPYKVVRIVMPPEGGYYPDTWGDYRTYTNSVFVNKTILVPTYEEEWDTTALRIYREALPGYNVVGIDCNEIITASGAIHCITKAVSTEDALLIRHQPLIDQVYTPTDYQIDALIKHTDGITDASVYWTTDTAAGYQAVGMTLTNVNEDIWSGSIPYQQEGEKVFYYVHAEAANGKQQVRPITAPQGYWKFKILSDPTGVDEIANGFSVYPNPSNGIFKISNPNAHQGTLMILDVRGKQIVSTRLKETGSQLDLSGFEGGLYGLRIEWEGGSTTELLNLLH